MGLCITAPLPQPQYTQLPEDEPGPYKSCPVVLCNSSTSLLTRPILSKSLALCPLSPRSLALERCLAHAAHAAHAAAYLNSSPKNSAGGGGGAAGGAAPSKEKIRSLRRLDLETSLIRENNENGLRFLNILTTFICFNLKQKMHFQMFIYMVNVLLQLK